jgi:DNA-binding transcriptional MocR family regulator
MRGVGRLRYRLEAIGLKPWIVPHAGMFLWCQLPKDVDAADLARASLVEGLVLAPGNAFSQSLTADNFIRINAAQSLDDKTFDILARCIAASKKSSTTP